MNRIFYECRDLEFPAGGVRRLYRHVEILRDHGLDATILHHRPEFKMRWFESSAPVAHWTDSFYLDATDVLVIPEGHVDVMRRAAKLPCRRVAIALNWGNIFRNLRVGETWRDFQLNGIIAGSNYEQEFLRATMQLDSTVIVSGIDTELFSPSADKRMQIVYMPRKNSDYCHLIMAAFRSRFRCHEMVSFVPVDMLTHRDVAQRLAQSVIFLAHTFPEGLSRKTLEAMACGNIVVGFSGHGSAECMEHEVNCFLADDGDILAVINYLGKALDLINNGAHLEMQNAAISTAHRYSLSREAQAVDNFWKPFLNESRLVSNVSI